LGGTPAYILMPLPHVLPFAKDPIYFFTACVAGRKPILSRPEAHECLRDTWTKSGEVDGWFVGRYVIMPDHVHLFARPAAHAKKRAEWIKSWKSISSRVLIKSLGLTPPLWQPDTFDHILRSSESYSQKWNYVRDNPVRKGLVKESAAWPAQGEIFPLEF